VLTKLLTCFRAYVYLHWSLVTAGLLLLHPARVFLVGRITKTGPAIDIHRRHTWLRCVLVGHWVAFVAAMYGMPLYLGKPAAFGAYVVYLLASGLIYGILSQVSHFNQVSLGHLCKVLDFLLRLRGSI
jgi:hypothetical protein